MSLSLKARFLLASLLAAALVLGYALFTLESERSTSRLLRETLTKNVSAMHLASEIKHSFVFYDDLTFRFLSTGDEALLEDGRRVEERLKAVMAQLRASSDSPLFGELLDDLDQESRAYFSDVKRLLASAPRAEVPGEKESILKMIQWARQVPNQQKKVGLVSAEGRLRLTRIYFLCDKLVDAARVRLEDVQKRIRDEVDENERRVRWGGGLALAGTVLVGLLLALSILAPLRELEAGIQRIMGGDLDFEIIPRAADEIGRITQAFNAMTRRLKEKQEQLVRETITDALTGLYNFRYFQQELGAEMERARRYNRPLSALLVDIDHFKKFNDTHGHEMGNVVLKAVAQALRETLRPTDLLARYGGEEFVVFLPETDREQGARTAERVREAVDALTVPGQETQPGGKLTISVGGSTFPEPAKSAKDLIEKADKALYRSKELGRNQVQWA